MRMQAALLIGFLAILGFTMPANADIGPPRPPMGMKYVGVDHELYLSKSVTGYVFVEAYGFGPQARFRKLILSDSKGTEIAKADRRIGVMVYAIPNQIAAKYKTDNELFKATQSPEFAEKCFFIGFGGNGVLKTTDRRDRVKWKHTITSIDEKKGPVIKIDGEGQLPNKGLGFNEKGEFGLNDNEPNETFTAGEQPASGIWMAGLAASLSIASFGLWFVRRGRRNAA